MILNFQIGKQSLSQVILFGYYVEALGLPKHIRMTLKSILLCA